VGKGREKVGKRKRKETRRGEVGTFCSLYRPTQD